MSKPQVIQWTVSSSNSVARTQTLLAAGTLNLNGSLANTVSTPATVAFINFSRNVILGSTSNVSAVNFTIAGKLNGFNVSETIAGPNVGLVETTQIFDIITSITTSAAAANVFAGTGHIGTTRYFYVDPYISPTQLTAQVVVSGTINYSFGITMDDVNLIANPTFFSPIITMTNATTSLIATAQIGALFATIAINSSSGAATLTSEIMQSGVR